MTIGSNDSGVGQYYLRQEDGSMCQLDKTEKEKDIGVIFDSKFTFENHISEKVKKANSMAGVIRRAYKYLTPKTFVPLYKALVRCHLEYAASVWSPYRAKYVDMIESVQRRATKYLPGFKDLTYDERLKKLNLPTLAYRRLRGDMIETYKIIKEIYDKGVAPTLILSKDVAVRSTRGHQFRLYKVRANKQIRANSFSYRIVNPWNSLPENVVNAPSLNAFKNRLDKYWKNQDILYDYKATLNLMGNTTPTTREQDVDIEDQEDLRH